MFLGVATLKISCFADMYMYRVTQLVGKNLVELDLVCSHFLPGQ